MPATYEPIASTTVSGTPTSVAFSSIPATFTDLVLVIAYDTSGSAGTPQEQQIYLNSDTATNYSRTVLYGTGSSAVSSRDSNSYSPSNNYVDGRGGISVVHFMSYANTNVYKTYLTEAVSHAGYVLRYVHLWRSTSAISSITLDPNGGATVPNGTVLSLYGIKAA